MAGRIIGQQCVAQFECDRIEACQEFSPGLTGSIGRVIFDIKATHTRSVSLGWMASFPVMSEDHEVRLRFILSKAVVRSVRLWPTETLLLSELL